MKILIINAFEESKRGTESFNDFKRTACSCLGESITGIPSAAIDNADENVIVRRPNALVDFVIDYQHELIDDRAKQISITFDNLDMIFIGGDGSFLPWDPKCAQIVTLLTCARKVNKPVFCCGSGAFMMVYSVCTGGTKFHILNEPYGETIDRLPTFARYAPETGQYPSAWLNNTNGDLFTYQPHTRCWIPVCNTGVFRSGSNAHAKFNHAQVENGSPRARVAHIHTQNTHPEYLKDLFTCNVPVSLMSDSWYLGWTGKLPAKLNIETLAEGPNGPIFVTIQNSLLLACELKDSPQNSSLRKIIVNYFTSLKNAVDRSMSGKISGSLHSYLFEKIVGTGRCAYELDIITAAENSAAAAHSGAGTTRYNVAPPVGGGFSISSSLPTGPVKVDAPLMHMMLTSPKSSRQATPLMSTGGKHTGQTQDQAVKSNFQNPKLLRRQRLEKILAETWNYKPEVVAPAYRIDASPSSQLLQAQANASSPVVKTKLELEREKNNRVIKDLLDSCANIGSSSGVRAHDQAHDQQMPESARNAYSGQYMNDVNIKHRVRTSSKNTSSRHTESQVAESIEPGPSISLIEDSYITSLGSASHTAPLSAKVPPVVGWKQSISMVDSQEDEHYHQHRHHGHSHHSPSKSRSARPSSASALKNFGAQGISAQLTENHLVHKHPNSARLSSKHAGQRMDSGAPVAIPHPPSSSQSSGNRKQQEDYSLYAPFTTAGQNYTAVKVPSHHTGPFTNYKKFETMEQQKKNPKAPYEGTHLVPYQTERERNAEFERESRKKQIGGDFKANSGIASVLPLRQPGIVQGSGPYQPMLQYPPDKQKNLIIAGAWKPSKTNPAV